MTLLQGFFAQLILYGIVWYFNPYIGFLLCIIFAFICASIVLFSFIAEQIEPSKVPKSYFKWMLVSIFPPIMVLIFFVLINQGDLYWLNN